MIINLEEILEAVRAGRPTMPWFATSIADLGQVRFDKRTGKYFMPRDSGLGLAGAITSYVEDDKEHDNDDINQSSE